MADRYLEKVKFLVVEDNDFMREVILQVLKALGAAR